MREFDYSKLNWFSENNNSIVTLNLMSNNDIAEHWFDLTLTLNEKIRKKIMVLGTFQRLLFQIRYSIQIIHSIQEFICLFMD